MVSVFDSDHMISVIWHWWALERGNESRNIPQLPIIHSFTSAVVCRDEFRWINRSWSKSLDHGEFGSFVCSRHRLCFGWVSESQQINWETVTFNTMSTRILIFNFYHWADILKYIEVPSMVVRKKCKGFTFWTFGLWISPLFKISIKCLSRLYSYLT